MEVTKYEIDMLDVKNADAFLVHFWDDETNYEYVVLIDGGNYEDGKTIANFIKKNYTQKSIDLVICSHCDKDHFGGLVYLLEQQRDNGYDNMYISQIWVTDPSNYISLGQVKWITSKWTLNVRARSVYDLDEKRNLLDILDQIPSIKCYEPFSDANNKNQTNGCANGLFSVVGPSIKYYKSLVLDFRNDLKRKKNGYDSDESQEQKAELKEGKAFSQTLADADDDPSPHNRSSVILLFQPSDGKKFLFMGDACRDSINNLDNCELIKNVDWLKVPHHGSKHNLDNDMINHIHPEVAYISTEKYGHYLSKAVVNTLKQIGTEVYSTNTNGAMCHHQKTPIHSGYSAATPL